MQTWIALFRGINVGGNNKLPMAWLKTGLESLKLTNVQTYIQSGNAVFQSTTKSSTTLAKKIGDLIESEHGFRPHLLVLTREQLALAIEQNPFPEATQDPKSLHFFFLAKPAAQAKLANIDKVKIDSERYQLTDGVFYLHTPDGLARSKVAATAEKHLGVIATARNSRTVEKLREIVEQFSHR